MTSGILSAIAFGAIAVAVIWGLMRRKRLPATGGDPGDPNTIAQWTEG